MGQQTYQYGVLMRTYGDAKKASAEGNTRIAELLYPETLRMAQERLEFLGRERAPHLVQERKDLGLLIEALGRRYEEGYRLPDLTEESREDSPLDALTRKEIKHLVAMSTFPKEM